MRCDVVVLGAGPAGLAAAWYARRRGFSVAVVEHASRVGGLAASTVVAGQTVDLGSHRLHPSICADLLADLRDVLGVDLQWRARNGRIRLDGRWLSFPLRPVDLLRHARPSLALGALRDLAWAPVRTRRNRPGSATVDSFARQVNRQLGPAIGRAFYEPYARKLWAEAPERLSPELFRRRVGAGSTAGIVRALLRRGARPGFWYPRAGFGAITDALAADVVRRGGTLLTGATIDAVRPAPDRVVVDLRGGRSIVARLAVSTIPSNALLTLTRSPPHVVSAAEGLAFRGAILVYLVVPRPQYSPYDAHYFPEPTTIVSRLSEPKNYRSAGRDPAASTVLCAEVPSTVGDDLWCADDGALGRRVGAELEASGLPAASPVAMHVERRARVYPVYRLGFERRQAEVDDHLDRWPTVVAIGRQALFAHDNTHHALLMGRTAVDALDGDARLDRGRWAAARRAFAGHVVED